MSNRAVVSFFFVLFFVILGAVSAGVSGYFYDLNGNDNIARAFLGVAVVCIFGAVASMVSLLAAVWE